MTDDNIIYVGKKNVSAYVLPVITALNNAGTVKVVARGNLISKAVDVSECAKRNFHDANVSIKIGTDIMESEDDKSIKRNVSTIEIAMDNGRTK